MTKRFLIAGAGAIGCTLAARLAEAGHDITVLARGRTLAVLQRDGVFLKDLQGERRVAVRAVGDVQDVPPQDAIFLCSKSQDLLSLAQQVIPAIGPQTLIVPLINGVPFWYFHREGGRFQGAAIESVDPQGALLTLLPMDQVLGAVVFITAESPEPGHVVSRSPHLLMLGEPGNGVTPRLTALCDAIRQPGLETRALERIRDKLWLKLIANLTSNPLSVISRATLGEIYTSPRWLPMVKLVMHEVLLAAAAYGARLDIDPINFLEQGAGMGAVRTSMLQDFERGRPLELAAVGDSFVELAGHYDLPVPHIQDQLAQVRALVAQRVPSPPAHSAALNAPTVSA
jgi:2-dehydropantoate 2-reductase